MTRNESPERRGMKRKREHLTEENEEDDDVTQAGPAKALRGLDTSGSSTSTTAAATATTTQPRADGRDRLSALPHELILRILQLLPVRSILLCQRLNKDWKRLAGDAQVWKGLYYQRWVRPRAPISLRLRPPVSWRRWNKRLDDGRQLSGYGASEARSTDWKARYRLRHNWNIGAAEVRELALGSDGGRLADAVERRDDGDDDDDDDDDNDDDDDDNDGALLAKLVGGLVVTADVRHGLRAWDLKGSRCIAKSGFQEVTTLAGQMTPSCLGVDTTSEAKKDGVRVVVGFADGGFWVWRLRLDRDGDGIFEKLCGKKPGRREMHELGRLAAVTYVHPYILTITDEQVLLLYSLDEATSSTPPEDPGAGPREDVGSTEAGQPQLLTSLKSHTCWPPLSLSIRLMVRSIVVSIAYALPTHLSGWSVGLQELHLTRAGDVSHSRIASAVEQGFQSLLQLPDLACPPPSLRRASDGRSVSAVSSRPASLSYSHPYLLAGNRDNTLMLYLVTSTGTELKISRGTRLWGHTSSVAAAKVGGRGKAVSISARGGELRVWELDVGPGTGSPTSFGSRSVQVRVGVKNETETATAAAASMTREGGAPGRAWIEFDDEVVVVLKDREDGDKAALAIYDFS